MNKTKLYAILAIAFFLLDLALIGFIMFDKPEEGKHPRHEGPKHLIIEKLSLDEGQVAAYEDIIIIHKEETKKNRGKVHQLKKRLFESLKDEIPELNQQLTKELSEVEKDFQVIHFNHFKALKDICREDQLEAFNELTDQINRLFSGGPPHGKRPPHKMGPK